MTKGTSSPLAHHKRFSTIVRISTSPALGPFLQTSNNHPKIAHHYLSLQNLKKEHHFPQFTTLEWFSNIDFDLDQYDIVVDVQ